MIHPDLPALALSVRQPWAWCIIHGGKHLENRTQGALNHMSRSVRHIAIHASTGMTRDEYEDVVDHPGLRERGLTLPRPDELIRGAIIGHVRIIDRISMSHSHWWCGPRALVLADPVAVDPIPVLGELGFFDWRAERCQTRVLNRYRPDEKRAPAAIDDPKPWMRAWPGRYHPYSNAPDKVIMPAETPLLDALQPKLPVNDQVVFPIDARTTDDERAGRTDDHGERGVTVTIHPREFHRINLKRD